MTLDKIAEDIIGNKDIHALLTDQPSHKGHPYTAFVEFQRAAYKEKGLDLEKQGFQVGEPWNGDIESAPILFLSSNPAFTFNENFPRYFADSRTFAMLDGTPLLLDEVKDFFRERFQRACVAGRGFHVPTIDPDEEKCHKEVRYWGCVRNNVQDLMPSVQQNGSDKAYFRKLMSHVVSVEVVPFKSSEQFGVSDEALEKCWNDFTQHILEQAAASIWVLVGKKVKATFLKHVLDDGERVKARGKFDSKEIYECKYKGGKHRLVVYAEFNRGTFSRFKDYFGDNVLDALKSQMSAALKASVA